MLDCCGVSGMDGHYYITGGFDFLPGISTQLWPIYQPVFIRKCQQCVCVLRLLSRWQLPVKPGYMFLEKKNELFPVARCGVNPEIEKANSAQESRVCWRHI